jgi:hypothetical protein
MSDPVSDSSAVDRLREQLIAVVGGELRVRFGPDWDWLSVSEAVTGSMLPIVAAFGDAREAAGREQGRQEEAQARAKLAAIATLHLCDVDGCVACDLPWPCPTVYILAHPMNSGRPGSALKLALAAVMADSDALFSAGFGVPNPEENT